MFALVWDNKEKSVRALNGSGRAPGAASIDELLNKGHRSMPETGVYSVAVQGTVHGGETLLDSCGPMPVTQVLGAPARCGGPAVVLACGRASGLTKAARPPSAGRELADPHRIQAWITAGTVWGLGYLKGRIRNIM